MSENKINAYVAGFGCSDLRDEGAAASVLLVKKNKPAYMAGLWNAIGGKIEPGETPRIAMAREFKEETGIDSMPKEWEPTVFLVGGDRPHARCKPFVVFFFICDLGGDRFTKYKAENDVGEKIDAFWGVPDKGDLKYRCLRNLQTMWSLAIDKTIHKPIMLCDETMKAEDTFKVAMDRAFLATYEEIQDIPGFVQ